MSVPSVRAPDLLGLRSAAQSTRRMSIPQPLQDGVAFGGCSVDVNALAVLLKLFQQTNKFVAMDIDSVLKRFVGDVSIERQVKLLYA